MQLQNISLGKLIAAAGGDPWAVNNSIQTGRPAQIADLAQAFHNAGQCTSESSNAFADARRRFEAAWNRESGERPINDSAEVQRITSSLRVQAAQLPEIAVDLENVAATLAQAQRTCGVLISGLERQLEDIDRQLGEAYALERSGHLSAHDQQVLDQHISDLEHQAIDDTKDTLAQLQSIRSGYSDCLQRSQTNLRTDGFDPASIQALDAPESPAKPDDQNPPHDDRPEIQDALSKPLPDDPDKLHDLWEKLTPQERDWLYQHDHSLGNHDGLPAVDRDRYNRLTLGEELAQAQAAATEADALQAQHPDWAQGKNIPQPNEPGAIFQDRLDYEAWQRRYDAARNGAKNLADLQAVDKTVKGNPDRKLLLLDTHTGRQTHAAVAVGDPDKATHVSVTTPGLNTTVHGSIGGMVDEATHLRMEALRQLSFTPGHEHDSVSAIAWIGYDTPQVPGWDDLGKSISGGWDVSHDDLAKAGAHDLARFYDGLGAAHQGAPAHLTAIGHSYGSLTTGLALQEPGNHGVTDALFYGSPGIEASTPQQLHVQPGHVYAMETPDDPIQRVYDAPPVAHAGASLLPFPFNVIAEGALDGAEATGAGQFGPNPATNPNFTHLGTGPATVPDGHGGTLNLEGAHGHSEYPRQGSNNLPRTTGYNIAAVVAGLGANTVRSN
ncbi:alpha/beta hydrolase [Mycobacterium xenopi]|uniref:Alpha/beta hydrolase n=1 Tax=Mycobacterium xenopi TaxID=1789 RepID=A0AAD1M0H5_MYCXE|nr:alpha/beta hydrolase [Mycobacterium xenopi]MDA3638297.1 alpha/beta hydrolase [Mycobacterium xenopi]MDA3656366.1 alpha/beta hydrolase [Mycobacterium xenopi]ORX21733.1 hypothetical protein AWC32_22355 [Mycobacterium xenopi]SPX91535.1 Alpha/beta hydrolase of uncharacterised function (DUF1023) [Mycobacterium xenopi]BBU21999.1 hypothetical protein MYXE_17890 [Mycobacterium xenopi]